MDDGDLAQAERLSARRPRMLAVLTILFLSQQAAYFSRAPVQGRGVDQVRIAAWLALSIVMLLVLVTGGGWIYSRRVRELANDESTRVFRSDALGLGFIASMVACIALYFLQYVEVMSGRETVHIVMTVGIAAALLRFAFLERRAQRESV